MLTNPNRFIRGLSDISDIVDGCCDDGPQVIESSPQGPTVVSAPPISTGGSFTLTAANFGEVEVTLSKDGAQTLTIPDSNPLGYALYINGFRQSKSAYTVVGNSLNLPDSLNVFTGDVITFAYMK